MTATSKKRSPDFSGKNRGATPSFAAPGVTHPSDATAELDCLLGQRRPHASSLAVAVKMCPLYSTYRNDQDALRAHKTASKADQLFSRYRQFLVEEFCITSGAEMTETLQERRVLLVVNISGVEQIRLSLETNESMKLW